MMKRLFAIYFTVVTIACCLFFSCNRSQSRQSETVAPLTDTVQEKSDAVIIDAQYTFNEAIAGTKAPQSVIDEQTLFEVLYLSTDGKLHQGQILTNKKIEADIRHIFRFMLDNGFVVEKAVPIVHYHWNDSLSMSDNNTYSFCYRNIAYSKHARGMAIDVNPRFNPVRWKKQNKPNEPRGAVSDTTVNGTLHPNHIVVQEFKKLGFRWGHTFSTYYDDHHFEKR